jgi:dolichol-phosphate mannosyltransferase
MRSTELSVIVPTYNETGNIRELCERLFKATKAAGLTAELFVVDDESPGSKETAKIIETLQKEQHAIRIHQRKRSEGRGLSSAVLLGFDRAKYATILCMDADLQHEPESVPAVADPVLSGEAEFSVGSRHAAGGGLGFEWSLIRRLISAGATALAFPVAKSTDPMSGFFCTTKKVLSRGRERCNPIGWKIGLEIAVRCRASPIKDVGITFQDRHEGESKLTMKQNVLYVRQLLGLYWDKFAPLLVLLVLLLIFLVVMLMKNMIS